MGIKPQNWHQAKNNREIDSEDGYWLLPIICMELKEIVYLPQRESVSHGVNDR